VGRGAVGEAVGVGELGLGVGGRDGLTVGSDFVGMGDGGGALGLGVPVGDRVGDTTTKDEQAAVLKVPLL